MKISFNQNQAKYSFQKSKKNVNSSNVAFKSLTMQAPKGTCSTIYHIKDIDTIRVNDNPNARKNPDEYSHFVMIDYKNGECKKHQLRTGFEPQKAQEIAENFLNAPNEVHRIDVDW